MILFQTYWIVFLAILFGSFITRATGLGFALIVVASLLTLPHIDQPTALFIAAPLSALNLGLIAGSLYQQTPWGILKQLSLPIVAGFILGFAFGVWVPKALILICGLIIVAYVFLSLVRPPQSNRPSPLSRPVLGGGLTGLMTGALAFPGPPISAFMIARGFIGDPIRVTVALVGLMAALARLLVGGHFTAPLPEFWHLMAIGSLLIFIGAALGRLTARRMGPGLHRILITIMILVAFLQLVYGLYRELCLV